MASLKPEKPVGTQLFGQPKKDSPKACEGACKAAATSKTPASSKATTKKAAPKPLETKKKGKGGKSASKQ